MITNLQVDCQEIILKISHHMTQTPLKESMTYDERTKLWLNCFGSVFCVFNVVGWVTGRASKRS